MPARHVGTFYAVPDLRRSAKRRSAPSRCEGKGKEKALAPRRTTSGADDARPYRGTPAHSRPPPSAACAHFITDPQLVMDGLTTRNWIGSAPLAVCLSLWHGKSRNPASGAA